MTNKGIKEKISTLPLCPGVYLMKDKDGNIIYVGKSKLLKNRVSQYFQSSAAHSPKTVAMVSQICDFEYIITETEAEALVLECNLIKKHRPKYNILLKDDKQYPYVKVTVGEDFPRIFVTRQIKKDSSIYLGPFTTAMNIREAVEETRKLFKIRNCTQEISEGKTKKRPCLYYQIGQCSAPCCGKITRSEYNTFLQGAISVLNGNCKDAIASLRDAMTEASNSLDFERAAELRDRISAISTLQEKQNISSAVGANMDFVGIYRENTSYCVQVFYYRNGKAVGSEYFTLENEQGLQAEVLESFVKQFYFTQTFIPREIYLSLEIEDKEGISDWLSKTCGHKVEILVPRRGKKADIMKMVIKNAQESLYKTQQARNRSETYQNRMLAQLKELLSLPKIPLRIESYDISHFSGSSATGVQIVYKNAAPAKALYRKYNIKVASFGDDYDAMREVLARRINEAYKEEDLIKEGKLKKENSKFLPLPDLILLDGGKGHVSSVGMLLDSFGEEIPLFGLVKDSHHKTRGITDGEGEFALSKNSELFKFLACMQDEVHRFAISATRKKHEKTSITSKLEKIPGVGPATRKKLLNKFGTLKGIQNASKDELKTIVSEKIASSIVEFFEKQRKM